MTLPSESTMLPRLKWSSLLPIEVAQPVSASSRPARVRAELSWAIPRSSHIRLTILDATDLLDRASVDQREEAVAGNIASM
eukprot:1426143-Prymnesium_polylepis.1